jgi:hypothetical protein
MTVSPFILETSGIEAIENLVASAAIIGTQLPGPSQWSPERRLAGAVLAAALVEIREHHQQRGYRRAIQQDLDWIFSDDTDWPFSFVPLCHTLAVEPEFVRARVHRWLNGSVINGNAKNPRDTDLKAEEIVRPSDRRRVTTPTIRTNEIPRERVGC